MVDKISSSDSGYQPGDLSYFPEAKDNWDSLYKATNNSETRLKQSLSFSGKTIIVEDNSNFPATGIIKIGPPAGESGNYELVYYQTKGQKIPSDETCIKEGKKLLDMNAPEVDTLKVIAQGFENSKREVVILKVRKAYAAFKEMILYYSMGHIVKKMYATKEYSNVNFKQTILN